MDSPIKSPEEDRFQRKEFAKRIVRALINANARHSRQVVVGITGEWGSGETSVLNLIEAQIKAEFPEAIVFSFNPWLINSANDLIMEFLRDLHTALKRKNTTKTQWEEITKSISNYAADLSPYADAALSLISIGPISLTLSPAVKALQRKSNQKKTLVQSKRDLDNFLDSIDVPVVVIIDEIDRAEADEIKIVAKLVRSVANFPRIAYLLGYDQKRVWRALGEGNDEIGKHYLEKIVQLPIPLPTISEAQFEAFFLSEANRILPALSASGHWSTSTRFEELKKLLLTTCLTTPRDIKRCIETFSVYASMVGGEVDTLDLLSFCTLAIKRPDIVDVIKADIEMFVANPINTSEQMASLEEDRKSSEEKFKRRFEDALKPAEPLGRLISTLFPRLSSHANKQIESDSDVIVGHRIAERPALTAVLRLGWPEGVVSIKDVRKFFALPTDQKVQILLGQYNADQFAIWTDRISHFYSEAGNDVEAHVSLWESFLILEKHALENSLFALHAALHNTSFTFKDVLLEWGSADEDRRGIARKVVETFAPRDPEFVSQWIRKHFFAFGLFGRERRSSFPTIFNEVEIAELARNLADTMRSRHLSSLWIPTVAEASALFLLVDTGHWDTDAQEKLRLDLANSHALEVFSTLMFGPGYSTGPQTIAKMVNIDEYHQMVLKHLGMLMARPLNMTLNEHLILETMKKASEELSPEFRNLKFD